MDFNDINSRLERLYISAGQRFDSNIAPHVQIKDEVINTSGLRRMTISFDRDHDENQATIKVLSIIGNLANLKDHLKNKFKEIGSDPEKVEEAITKSFHLQLILDLYNQEKHGSPLIKFRRSGKDPRIVKVSQALSVRSGGKSNTASFTIDPFSGQIRTEGDVVIVITAEIIDNQGQIICYLDELIKEGIKVWESLI